MPPTILDPAAAIRSPMAPPRERPGELRRAAEAFESIFVESLLRTMTRSQLESGFFGSEGAGETYQGMFEAFLAQRVAEGSPFGIARLLEEVWSSRAGGTEEAAGARQEARKIPPFKRLQGGEDTE